MTIHQTAIRPAVTQAEQRFLDLYAGVADRLPGARIVEIRSWREAGLEQFVRLGLPHRRIEEWKYTDLRVLMPEVRPLAGLTQSALENVSLEAAVGKSLAGLDAYRAVFVDGLFRGDLSSVQNVPGVTFQPLRLALDGKANSTDAITSVPIADRDAIAALAAAFATDGAILSVAPETRLEKPIHMIFMSSNAPPKLTASQNAIGIGERAQVTLIETHAALDRDQAIAVTRLAVKAHASLKHIRVNTGPGSQHLSSAAVTLGEGAHYETLQMTVDGALTRAQVNIRFEGPGARCHYIGAMMLRGQSHADFTLVVDHAAEGCESRELVKAVLDGRSRGIFQGKVIVQRGAQKTDGKQMANALLLSDDAEFDSKPELEIYADDVVCGHGATAGQLDEDMLFYLRARGIPEIEARALLIAAFVGEALDKIENEALRDALLEKVDAWLQSASDARPAV